jgi:tetratricopeptide (TPR) repeat protein
VAARDPFVHYSGCTVPSWIDEVDDPVASGSIYYDGACYGKAAEQWGKALAKRPGLVGLRVLRANALHFSGSNGIALQELQTAIDTLRGRDAKKLGRGRLYDSKEWLEYKIGLIQMQEENYAAAREAFGRALAENLAFYQAHARIGDVDMLQNDVEGAIAEYDQAVQLKGADDPVLHDTYGVALLRSNTARFADAEAQFRKAIELAPEYAIPYYNLAVALAKQGKKDDAIAQFRAFVAHAPRNNVRLIDAANKSIAALQGATTAGGPQ